MASSNAYYSPDTQSVMRRSKYLTDALAQMQQPQEIKGGWGELAARLGATAILARGQKKADRELADVLAKEAEARKASILGQFGLGGPQTPTPAQGPAQTPAASVDPIQAASMAPGAPQAQTSMPSPSVAPTGRRFSALVEALMPGLIQRETGGRVRPGPMTRYGQANGLTQMLDPTAEAMAKKMGLPWRPDLLRAKTKEALEYQTTLGSAYLQEGLDATGNPRDALRYYHGGPDRSQWGPKTNAYADAIMGGLPQAQMTGGPAPQSPMQVSPTMAGALSGGPAPAPQPQQQPMGFPPMPEPQPQPQAPPQAPQQAPQQAWGPAPGELQYLQQLASDPRTIDAAQAYADDLRKKYAAPPKMETYSANGVPMAFNPYAAQAGALPVPQGAMNRTTTAGQLNLPGDPNAAYSVSPYGKPDAITTAPPGYNFGPNGSMAPAQGGPADPYRVQAPPQGYQMGAQGMAPVAGGPADISGNPQARFEALKGVRAEIRPVIDSAIALRRNYSALLAGYAQRNGTGDVAMTNGVQKMIDEGVVREGDVALQLKAQGIEGGLAGLAGYANSDGMYSPAIRDKLKLIGDDLYGKISGTYRQRVEGYRGMVERTFGEGSFADVLPPETAGALGWTDQPQGQGAPQGGQGQQSGAAPSGAQRAQDGKYYIQDPTKPGSFPEVRRSPRDGKWYLKASNGQYYEVN